MSAAETLQRGRGRTSAAADLTGASPAPAAGKRTLAAQRAPLDFEEEDLEEEDLEEADGGSAREAAGDWDMSSGLASAMGLELGSDAAGAAAPTAPAAPVRRKASASGWANEGGEVGIAQRGFSGAPAADFPHRAAIESSFGAPLPATAYTGGAAAKASEALGADGYALGNQVAFASASPSLEVAAHEAAHIMQATSGVQLHGGTGSFEDHADAVAARVVRGESSADLLAAGPVATPEVRRHKNKGEQRQGRGKGKGKKKKEKPAPRDRDRDVSFSTISKKRIQQLLREMRDLMQAAQWSEIRKTAYPRESQKNIARAKQRQDGKLPELTGLGQLTTFRSFAAAVKRLQSTWGQRTVPERTQFLLDAINEELTAVEVPQFLRLDLANVNHQGAFDSSTWTMELKRATIAGGALSQVDAADLCNTMLHEARHAEQAFLAARYAAGPGGGNKNVAAIVNEHNLPQLVAQAAFDHAFDDGTDAAVVELGEEMHQAWITDGAANQHVSDDDYTAEMAQARQQVETARYALSTNPDPQTFANALAARDTLKAAIKEVERRYTLYRDIPYERDAHDVGDAVELIFNEL